jgi:glycosyltransferase involved in cell wall biosynthesis
VNPPTISAVIPAYNAEKYVAAAIESALAQTIPPSEIVVVDDGSKDGTAGVASRVAPGVKVLRQPNGGPAAARNTGIRNSTGEWIAFLDADDTWVPNKLELQAPFTEDSSIGIINGTDFMEYPPFMDSQAAFDALWKRNFVNNSAVLIRRAAVEAIGGLDEDRALIGVEDYNLWLRVSHVGWKVANYPAALFNYTPAPGNLSSQVERFARAELANLESLSARLSLDSAMVRRKRAALYEQYGRELLHNRQLPQARRYLTQALLHRPTFALAAAWLGSHLPAPLLNLRRSRAAGLS